MTIILYCYHSECENSQASPAVQNNIYSSLAIRPALYYASPGGHHLMAPSRNSPPPKNCTCRQLPGPNLPSCSWLGLSADTTLESKSARASSERPATIARCLLCMIFGVGSRRVLAKGRLDNSLPFTFPFPSRLQLPEGNY